MGSSFFVLLGGEQAIAVQNCEVPTAYRTAENAVTTGWTRGDWLIGDGGTDSPLRWRE